MLTEEDIIHIKDMFQDELSNKLIIACMDGDVDLTRYLLTSSELKRHANINVDHSSALVWSVYGNHLDIVKYLLTSPELIEHLNIHIHEDFIFKNTCNDHKTDMMDYLIFDYKITKTQEIETYLVKSSRQNILDLFEKRELEEKLQLQLQLPNSQCTKLKL